MTVQPDVVPLPWSPPDTKRADGEAPSPPAPGTAQPRTGPSSPRRVAPDHRLRGLALDAAARIEPPTPPRRRKHPSVRRRRRRLAAQWTIGFVVVAVVATSLRLAAVRPYTISTTAMVPTLQPDTGVLVVTATWLRGPLQRGDVVVLHQPTGTDCGAGDLVARVIGMPGQTIWSVGQSVYIDGQVLDEPGWYNVPFGEVGTSAIPRTTIPAGSYFVMGDNRTDSCDSRRFGPIDRSLVVGEVVATTTRNGHPDVHIV